MKERLRIQGLRKRWILNSVGPVILILVLAAILASATVANNYYGSARSTLEAKAKAGADYFNSYSMSSYSEYYRNASLYAASFDSTRIELQFLNLYGRVDNSTQGVAAGTAPQTPEIARALESGSIEVFSGKDPVTGESVMAVTTPLKFNGSTVAFMRYVTATRQIDHQILLTILIISAIIAGVICLVLISSLLFINSVVAPVAEVTDAAKRISGGSYGIQLPNPYTDEMGELVDNINDMSLKISQSEKIQTEFISSVSHELRTPLTAINGWSETLLEDDDPAQLRRGLHIILKESRRLTNMVEELLEFSRIEAGRFNLSVEPLDIVAELEKPGRDPRDSAPEVVFSKGIRSFDDLVPGMELTGTVRNVVDFGAFVDIGVKQDGLVHVSKLADRFVRHPSEVVAVGDTVTVWVTAVDKDRGKISLSMVKGKA